jgi:hypothetical protein
MIRLIGSSSTVLEQIGVADEWVVRNAIIAVENTRLPINFCCTQPLYSDYCIVDMAYVNAFEMTCLARMSVTSLVKPSVCITKFAINGLKEAKLPSNPIHLHGILARAIQVLVFMWPITIGVMQRLESWTHPHHHPGGLRTTVVNRAVFSGWGFVALPVDNVLSCHLTGLANPNVFPLPSNFDIWILLASYLNIVFYKLDCVVMTIDAVVNWGESTELL